MKSNFENMIPNVFVLTIDSLRGDQIVGNSKTSLTPNIDELISNGTYFTQAISTADGTGISLGSLFTGGYPFNTGITHFKFNPEATNFLQIFQNNGYHTCVTIPDVSFLQKLTQDVIDQDPYVYDKRQSWLQLGGGIGQQIINKLKQMPKSPWLYYIHLQDLHQPFFLPTEYDSDKFGDTRYARMISYIDTWIGKFLEVIDLSKTIVVISADHGEPIETDEALTSPKKTPRILIKGKETFPSLEPLGVKIFLKYKHMKKKYKINKLKKNLTEKQFVALLGRGQNHLYDEHIKIPLILAGYKIPSSKTISTQVRQIDIFPSIADISEINIQNHDVDGTSVVPLLNNESFDEIPAYIETTPAQNPTDTKINLTLIGKSIGIRTSYYKFWRSRLDPKENVYLFDLKSDPKEEKNIANEKPDVVNKMESMLQNILKNSSKVNEKQLVKDDDELIEEELKKLGYI